MCVERIRRHISRSHHIGKEEQDDFIKKFSADPKITIDPKDDSVESSGEGDNADTNKNTNNNISRRGMSMLLFPKKMSSAEIKTLKLGNEQWKLRQNTFFPFR